MQTLIHRLFGAQQQATVLCPNCERAMEGHDDAACRRRMSRRYFFGLGLGAMAASVVGLPPIATECINLVSDARTPWKNIGFEPDKPIPLVDIYLRTEGFIRDLIGKEVMVFTDGKIYRFRTLASCDPEGEVEIATCNSKTSA